MTSFFYLSYLLGLDLENDKFFSMVSLILDIGSRNRINGDDAGNGVIIIVKNWNWWTTADVDRLDWILKPDLSMS